jgi:hypothetical protein
MASSDHSASPWAMELPARLAHSIQSSQDLDSVVGRSSSANTVVIRIGWPR